MTRVRCAVYTRKSSEEGLEQDFNSLDAQHEACSAYILSQASEGWQQTQERYDDGGLSGGTLQRSGLQRLLADIEAGKLDIVVVYKVDRLTRSLLDFAKLVDAFDKAGVSFVSVTQSFNTTTSMGRLTLNMLLSFAQFEREVTAERIRDKIAASKRKGMWMGGTPPLGYKPNGRTLTIVESEAELIRTIFSRYLADPNVRTLAETLERDGIVAPERTTAVGKRFGGGAFTRGQLYHILKNPIYAGYIRHGDERHEGQHDAIVPREQWHAVQAQLADNVQGRRSGGAAAHPSPFAGLVFDRAGEPLVATHATKGQQRYRYYVSRSLQHGIAGAVAAGQGGLRIPAKELEAVAREALAKACDDPLALLQHSAAKLPLAVELGRVAASAADLAQQLRGHGNNAARDRLPTLIERVTVFDDHVVVRVARARLLADLGGSVQLTSDTAPLEVTMPVTIKRSGLAVKLVLEDGRPATGGGEPDRTLLKAIMRARGWWATLQQDPELTIEQLSKDVGITGSYFTRVLRLAFLDPHIIRGAMAGMLPAGLSAQSLTRTGAMPIDWREQRRMHRVAARH